LAAVMTAATVVADVEDVAVAAEATEVAMASSNREEADMAMTATKSFLQFFVTVRACFPKPQRQQREQ